MADESTELPLSTAVNIEDEMRQSYMDYAMSVIIGRALPDARDGLKPVQKRVLYAMLQEGLTSNRKTSKCAGVVGEVLKTLHPHGDIPVYDALVRLAQPWSMRYPLVDGQGNFGSIDGDPPAAYRYTECRMTAIAERLLEDIDKDTVDFIPNFDETGEEPVVLPARIPNLLVNGADGIAVGMATHIPPHNLGEVISGTIACLENPDITVSELLAHIPGPDFPTGGIINGRSAIVSAYATGRGIVHIRARASIETVKTKSREVSAIVVTEIPYQVNKSRLLEKIAELVNTKMVEGVARLRDESDRQGMRIVIELKRDATAEVVLNQLYKNTPLQSSFGVINLAIVEGKPVVCTLKQLLNCFIDHRRDVVTRRTQYELRKARERMHLLEGFRIALLNLDEIIALIRGAETPADAKSQLISRFDLSVVQAQAILDLRLQKLTGMERLAVENEYNELRAEIDRLTGILQDSKRIDQIIVDQLQEMKEQFGDPRRTSIEEKAEDIGIEDMLEDSEMVVTISHRGYAKRTSTSNYRAQKRGGKGVSGLASVEGDFVEHLFVASTLSDLLVFTSLGRVYSLKVYEIPEVARTARGRALVNLLHLQDDELITAILPVDEFTEGRYVVMATRFGLIKKTELMAFARLRKSGIIACGLADGDRLIRVGISHGNDEVLLSTGSGMAIRFSEENIRPTGRTARGVRGIRFEEGDEVVGMALVASAPTTAQEAEEEERCNIETDTLLTVCENGYGKRTALSDYRSQSRGGRGTIDIRTNERNGRVVSVIAVTATSEIMLITSAGKIIRTAADDISVIGRATAGVRLINLDVEERVAAVSRVAESEEEAEAEGNGENGENGESGESNGKADA